MPAVVRLLTQHVQNRRKSVPISVWSRDPVGAGSVELLVLESNMYSEDNDNSWAPPASDAEDSRDSFNSDDDNDDEGWSKSIFSKNVLHDGVPEEYQPSSAFVPPENSQQVTGAV